MLRYAAILSLVIILEMAWAIYAKRSLALSRNATILAVHVIVATAVLYILLVSLIAARVVAPLIYRL